MSIRRAIVPPALALACHVSFADTSITLRPGPSAGGVTNGDTFVTSGPEGDFAGNNYGGAGALAVAAAGSLNGPFSAVIRFDASAAKAAFDAAYGPGGWRLEAAALQLTLTPAVNPIFNPTVPGAVDAHWIADDSWVEGTGNPNSPSTFGLAWNGLAALLETAEPAGRLDFQDAVVGVPADYSLIIRGGLAADVAAGGPVGFAFTAGDSEVAVVFNSRSHPMAERHPALTLTAGPVLPEIAELRTVDGRMDLELVFAARAGMKLTVQASEDLSHWADVAALTATDGLNTTAVSAPPGNGHRYWRLLRRFP